MVHVWLEKIRLPTNLDELLGHLRELFERYSQAGYVDLYIQIDPDCQYPWDNYYLFGSRMPTENEIAREVGENDATG
jgi:hypothetical protein